MSDLKIDYGDLHALVGEGHVGAEARRARRGRLGRFLRGVAFRLLAVVVLVTLPFVVLVRVGAFAHGTWGVGGWGSALLGGIATAVLLAGYAWGVGRRFGGGPRVRRLLTRGAWGVAIAWGAYACLYVAAANVKGTDVREEYRSLHPLLRLATSVVFVADGETVITDAGRSRDDYWRMGLPLPEASLHFPQEDGFVHALDIRTRGRREWRNRGLELVFWTLGLNTLRHVGTADHLHVSLRPPAD